MNILYLIPARGGSKGLPHKNKLPLYGKPLIAWSIGSALHASFKGRTVVSTDEPEIRDIAFSYGAEAPFLRPSNLSTDEASGIDVILHALQHYENQGIYFDYIMLLQPTSPLRTSADLDAAFHLLQNKKAKAVVSVCKTDHHPFWANTLPSDGSMKDFIRPELKDKNRQQLPDYYRLNGAIYLAETAWLKKTRTFIEDGTTAYIMPHERSVDIDTAFDLQYAEFLLQSE